MRGSVYARAYALARRLAVGSRTPYDFVQQVAAPTWQRGFRYSETPPHRAVPLEDFLFTRPPRLLPAVLGRDGAAAAHGRRARRAWRPASRPGSFDARHQAVRGARLRRALLGGGLVPGHRLGDLRPDAGDRARARPGGSTAARRPRAAPSTRDVGRRGSRARPARAARRSRRRRGPPLGGAAGGLALLGGAAAPRPARRAARWSAGLPDDPALAELERALRRTGRPPAPATTLRDARARASRTRRRRRPTSARCARRASAPAGRRPTARSAARCAARWPTGSGLAGGCARWLGAASAAARRRRTASSRPRPGRTLGGWPRTSTTCSAAAPRCWRRATTTPAIVPLSAGARTSSPRRPRSARRSAAPTSARGATARPPAEFQAVVDRAPDQRLRAVLPGPLAAALGRHAEARRPLALAAQPAPGPARLPAVPRPRACARRAAEGRGQTAEG